MYSVSMVTFERLEQKWRDIATLFYVQRRWLYQLSQVTEQLRAATGPPARYSADLTGELVSDLESLSDRLSDNAEDILALLGG